jgi:hypothetical protein
MEENALETMGENKASYMTKSMVDKLPEADQDVCSPSFPLRASPVKSKWKVWLLMYWDFALV